MCEVCGHTPCKPLGGKMADEHCLTADDWRRIYEFIRYVELPFMHTVLADARARAGLTPKGNLKHRNE